MARQLPWDFPGELPRSKHFGTRVSVVDANGKEILFIIQKLMRKNPTKWHNKRLR